MTLPQRRTALSAAALAMVEAANPDPGGPWCDLAAELAVMARNREQAGELLPASGCSALARGAQATAVGVLEVAAIAVTVTAVLAILGGIAYVALHARGGQARNHQTMSLHAPARQTVTRPLRRAIEASRPSLADIEALAAEHGYDLTHPED